MKKITYTVEQLLMLERVIGYTLKADNITITDSIPAFSDAINQLKADAQTLSDDLDRYKEIITGLADQKKKTRLDLALLSAAIMLSVRSYAINNGNLDLAAKMKTSFAKIKNMPYKKIMSYINDAINAVDPLVGSLADYNVTPAIFTTWKGLRDTMSTWLNAPQSAITDRKGLGITINNELSDIMDFLHTTVDTLVENFRDSHPEYFNQYWTARKVYHTGIRHTGLEAFVTDELGQPFVGITVTVDVLMKDDKTYHAVSGKTDEKGFVHISTFESGIRNVTIDGHAVISKTFTDLKFVHGQILKQTFVMKPALGTLPESTPSTPETATANS